LSKGAHNAVKRVRVNSSKQGNVSTRSRTIGKEVSETKISRRRDEARDAKARNELRQGSAR